MPLTWGDRGDREDPPAVRGTGAAQGLAVDRCAGQRPGRRGMFPFPLGRPALLALRRARGARDHRRGGLSAYDVRGVSAGGKVQGGGVQVGRNPAEGPLAGRHEPITQRVPASADPFEFLLRGARRPLPYRRHGVVAHDQRCARGQDQNYHQRVASATSLPSIRNLQQPPDQRGFHHGGPGGQLGLPQRQILQLVKGRGDRGRYGHERDSCDDLLA
jgi:hypothetical protein